jgi:hypothetical protein
VTLSDAPPGASGPVAGSETENVEEHRTNACPTGKARPRANRRRAEAAGESDGRIRAMMVGNGLGTRTQRSKGGQC